MLKIKSVEDLKQLTVEKPVNSGDELNVVCSAVQLDYQYKEGTGIVTWQPSESQEVILEFLGKNGTFGASNIRQKLVSKDAKKWTNESKLITDKFVLSVCKKAAIFGLSGFTCRISAKGNLTFKFSNEVPTSLPFCLTFRSPEEKRADALAALGKRVSKALDDTDERAVVESAVDSKKVSLPAVTEKIA